MKSHPATHVVVLGAGYGGLMATNRFLGSLDATERQRVTVTVINPRDVFVERIRLHQLVAGSLDTVTRPLAAVLHPDATLIRGTAELIDPVARTVTVRREGGSETLTWDHLVYAVGSRAAAPVHGAREHAFLLADLDGAQRAAAALGAAGRTPQALVIGGGFTGVEAAAELAEQHPRATVTLLSGDTLVPTMRAAARASIRRSLRRLDVSVLERTEVAEVEQGYALTSDGHKLQFDVCVLAASFDVPPLARTSGLDVDAQGRLLVDDTLRSLSCPAILGVGDAVAVAGKVGAHLRMACSVAVPMGGHAASELVGSVRGGEPAPFDMGFSAQCVSLGRRRGYIQLVNADDSPRRLHVGGALGARVKESVCRRVLEAPTAERTRPGTYTWRHGGAR